jgi:hypothetical protein
MLSPQSSPERIKWLSGINCGSTYLEVGVSQGVTFNAHELDHFDLKVAVDPCFKFDFKACQSEKVHFYEATSDQFFSSLMPDKFLADIIYLDGLHTFQQTFRDFCSSLACKHSKTIWLIDDIKPLSVAQAEPDFNYAVRLKKAIDESIGWWMGDVYKVVIAIHDYFPSFSYAILPGQTWQAVVWQEPRKSFTPYFNNFEQIERLRYQDFLLLQNLFPVADHSQLETRLKSWMGDGET